MSQVLQRATRLLEALARRPVSPLGPLARQARIPASTAVRLLQALAALDWVEQVRPRGPYRLGPRSWMLTERYNAVEPLLRRTRPLLATLAAELRQPFVLVRLSNGRRQVLQLRAPRGAAPAVLARTEGHLYETPTGRLLLAHEPARNRKRLLDRLGLPAPEVWRGIADRDELEAELRELRREGYIAEETARWHHHAAWIGRWNGEGACIGTFAPPGRLHPDTGPRLRAAREAVRRPARPRQAS